MSSLAQLFDDFHSAILTRDAAHAIPHLKPNPQLTPQAQMAIYIDGYRIRLLAAIRSDYPILLTLLGDEPFGALARAYIESNPPTDFNLDRYPHGFAAFLTTQAIDPFALNIARFESALAQVFMLPNSTALPPSQFTRLNPDDFGTMQLHQRVACQLLAFDYPVDAVRTPPAPQATYLCMVRHENDVKRHALTPAAYCLLGHLFAGKTVAEALDAAMADRPGDALEIAQNLQSWFADWLKSGFFRACAAK